MPKPIKSIMWRVQFLNKGKPDNTPHGVTYIKTKTTEEATAMIKKLHPGRAFRLQSAVEYDEEMRGAFADKVKAFYARQEAKANGRPAAKEGQKRKVRTPS